MTMKTEIWKDIVGYEGYYQVSNLGRIRSLDRTVTSRNTTRTIRGKILKPKINSINGYNSVMLGMSGVAKYVRVHRVVAQSFIDNPDNKPEINHINGNKSDNRVLNLEWVTHRENHKHRISVLKQTSGAAKITKNIADEIRERFANGNITQTALGKEYGLCQQNISLIINRKCWV